MRGQILYSSKEFLIPLGLVLTVQMIALALPFYQGGGTAERHTVETKVEEVSALPTPEPVAALPARQLKSTEVESVLKHKVARGETLFSILGRYGAGSDVAEEIRLGFAEAGVDPREFKHGETIEIVKGPGGDLLKLRKKINEIDQLQLARSSEGRYLHSVVKGTVLERRRIVSGTIANSFAQAAAEVELPYSIVDELVDLFSSRIEFRRDLREGDTFSVIYTERRDTEGTVLTTGAISAASIKNGGKLLVAVRHVGQDGKSRYFDEKGAPLGDAFLRYPVAFSRISSMFSESRFHPLLKSKRPHNGVDFAAPTGTPVRSVGDGVVVSAGYAGASGNLIKINHGSRYSTAYLHLSKIAPEVKPGRRVFRGQIIGAVGATGLATGPHLHFSLYDRGRYIDPLTSELPQEIDKGDIIPPSYLEATLRTLKDQHEQVLVSQADRGPKA